MNNLVLSQIFSEMDDRLWENVYNKLRGEYFEDVSFLKKEGIKPFKFIEEKPIDLGLFDDAIFSTLFRDYLNREAMVNINNYFDEFH